MSLTPFLRLPLTDLTGCLINHQTYDKCGKFEMKMMECFEAYGLERGKRECADLISDFQECVGMQKQLMRFHVGFRYVAYHYEVLYEHKICILGHEKRALQAVAKGRAQGPGILCGSSTR